MGITRVRIRHDLRFNDYGLAGYISDLVGVVSDRGNQYIESWKPTNGDYINTYTYPPQMVIWGLIK